jgi:hypothetical protein
MTQQYNNESFIGEHSYRWESGVDAPINSQTKQQKALQLLNTISTITSANQQLAGQINWTELLRSTLTDLDVKNIEQILTPDQNMQGQIPGQIPGQDTGQPPIDQSGQVQGQGVDPNLVSQIVQSLGGQ